MKQKVFEIKSGIPVIKTGAGVKKPKKIKPKKVKRDHPYVATLKKMKSGQCFDVPCINPTGIKTLWRGYYGSQHKSYRSNSTYTNIRYYADRFLKEMNMNNTHRVVIRGILNEKCYRVWLLSK